MLTVTISDHDGTVLEQIKITELPDAEIAANLAVAQIGTARKIYDLITDRFECDLD